MKESVIFTIFIVMVLFISSAYCQSGFEVTIGGDQDWDIGYCIKKISGSRYLVGGSYTWEESAEWDTETDALLLFIDASGNEISKTRIATIARYTGSDKLEDIIETSDGGFAATGTIQSENAPSKEDLLVAKFDANGDTAWTKVYNFGGYDFGRSIVESADGGFIVGGGIANLSGENELMIMKTDANGDSVWTLVTGGSYEDRANGVWEDALGNIYVIGYTQYLGGYTNHLWFMKLSSDGGILIEKYLGADEGLNIVHTSDDNFLTATKGEVVKIDKDGNILWKTAVAPTAELKYAIEASDGSIYATGKLPYISADWSNINEQLYLAKINAGGDTAWTKDYGLNENNRNEHGYCLTEAADGGVVVTGYKYMPGQYAVQRDIYLLKVDAAGTTAIEETLSGTAPAGFSLKQNYPNPFNPQTRIRYSVARTGRVSLDIYSVAGMKVRSLVNTVKAPGTYSVTWEGKNDAGSRVAAGTYMYILRFDGNVVTRKMTFLK